MEVHSPRGALRHALFRTLPAEGVVLDEGFWRRRQETNRTAGLNHGYARLEAAGNVRDLELAAGSGSGSYVGKVFMDSDVYKWLEAAAYELSRREEPDLRARVEGLIALLERAQQADGYLDSYFQVAEPEAKWQDLSHGHELYCAGHLIEAAISFRRLLGDSRLFTIATRLADHIERRFGEGETQGTPGHPEIELALVELYRETGERRYLELASYFVGSRGRGLLDWGDDTGHNGPSYFQDHVPVRESSSVEGHAVRQLYLNAGATDLYLETGDETLLDAMLRQWENMTAEKMYVTGGLGSRHLHEAFSESYELPNSRAYDETCAAIASIMWSWRLLLATGESRFADLIEHTLYNAFLSGVSLDSTRYFYCNPLLSYGSNPHSSRKRIERMAWPWTPCCPPNVMRTIALIGHYVATSSDDALQIHQYLDAHITARMASGSEVAVSLSTGLPWSGETSIVVESGASEEWTLMLRRPAWAPEIKPELDGRPLEEATLEKGYLCIRRRWSHGDRITLSFGMEPYFVEAHPLVDSTFASLAVKRGPLVYCFEQTDQDPGVDVLYARVDERRPPRSRWRGDLLGGIEMVEAQGSSCTGGEWQGRLYRRLPAGGAKGAEESEHAREDSASVALRAIPYYAWANRGPNAMRVWMPRRLT